MHCYLQTVMAIVFFANGCGAAIAPLSTTSEASNMSTGITLEFANPAYFEQVQLIHDTVMGGRSEGAIEKVSAPVGLRFYGNLSLANNGGFASVEFRLAETLSLLPSTRIELNAAADGRKYQLRLKTPGIPRGVAYVAKFEASTSETHFSFQPSSFVGQYRGRQVANLPQLNFADISHISLMLADKDSGPFSIVLYSLTLSMP